MKFQKLCFFFLIILSLAGCRKESVISTELYNRYLLAKKYYTADEQAEAKIILEKIYDEEPDFYQSSYLYGKVLQFSGNEELALEVYESILETYPYYIDPAKQAARIYLKNKKSEKAEAIITTSLSWSQEDPTLIFLLSKVRSMQNRYEEALSLLVQADGYMERMVEIHLENALLMQNYGLYKEALNSITRAISLVKEDNPLKPSLEVLKERLENEL